MAPQEIPTSTRSRPCVSITVILVILCFAVLIADLLILKGNHNKKRHDDGYDDDEEFGDLHDGNRFKRVSRGK